MSCLSGVAKGDIKNRGLEHFISKTLIQVKSAKPKNISFWINGKKPRK